VLTSESQPRSTCMNETRPGCVGATPYGGTAITLRLYSKKKRSKSYDYPDGRPLSKRGITNGRPLNDELAS